MAKARNRSDSGSAAGLLPTRVRRGLRLNVVQCLCRVGKEVRIVVEILPDDAEMFVERRVQGYDWIVRRINEAVGSKGLRQEMEEVLDEGRICRREPGYLAVYVWHRSQVGHIPFICSRHGRGVATMVDDDCSLGYCFGCFVHVA